MARNAAAPMVPSFFMAIQSSYNIVIATAKSLRALQRVRRI